MKFNDDLEQSAGKWILWRTLSADIIRRELLELQLSVYRDVEKVHTDESTALIKRSIIVA